MAKKQVDIFPTELIRQLGKMTDAALADEYQISIWRIRSERLRRGISRAQSRNWTSRQIALLGKMSDSEAARRRMHDDRRFRQTHFSGNRPVWKVFGGNAFSMEGFPSEKTGKSF